MGHDRGEHADDLHAELGYRPAGRREVRVREWFSLRGEPGEPAPTPKAFAELVGQLRRRAPNAKKNAALKGARVAVLRGLVFSCVVCGAEWCQVRRPSNGTVPDVCSAGCWKARRKATRARYNARRLGRLPALQGRATVRPGSSRKRARERGLYAKADPFRTSPAA